jgi:hypothetical protein
MSDIMLFHLIKNRFGKKNLRGYAKWNSEYLRFEEL